MTRLELCCKLHSLHLKEFGMFKRWWLSTDKSKGNARTLFQWLEKVLKGGLCSLPPGKFA